MWPRIKAHRAALGEYGGAGGSALRRRVAVSEVRFGAAHW